MHCQPPAPHLGSFCHDLPCPTPCVLLLLCATTSAVPSSEPLLGPGCGQAPNLPPSDLSFSHASPVYPWFRISRIWLLTHACLQTAVRTLSMLKPTRDLRTRLMAASGGMNDAETRDLNHFIDLLEHCLTLNPDKRIKAADALRHPFFTSRTGTSRR
ncbi:hypothetical protein B0J13DRAFT_105704 [Dactylonectria estremocensis]|uniref:Protein kinase domain-containing protein n=1 Tax=Dactylonectria estremocensis TaxID=1079267 RepID=A0A9P9E6L6_9HYPO|nr:hypothetical protein B0J13DRAFT_105704 [Dactylonectria estremocensis]